jgi:hypothetical protein
MKTATLLIDVYSCFGNDKKKALGMKGEKVKIIADHAGTLIVEGKTRFTVTQNEIDHEEERAD